MYNTTLSSSQVLMELSVCLVLKEIRAIKVELIYLRNLKSHIRVLLLNVCHKVSAICAEEMSLIGSVDRL